jgi:hypothetical protein
MESKNAIGTLHGTVDGRPDQSACPATTSVSRLRARAVRVTAASVATFALLAWTAVALAAGSFRLRNSEVQEISGGWRVMTTIELPKAPPISHVPMKFIFTKTAVFERALVDNHSEPVFNRIVLQNQPPMVESIDVGFADASGKPFKKTIFDFSLTRARGYEAGEYKVQLRSSDGSEIGSPQTLTLKGDNPVVDRRSITFNASSSGIKKVESGVDGGVRASAGPSDEPAAIPSQEVEPVGTAAPFIPPEAYDKQPEEEVRERPKGCGGCALVSSADSKVELFWFGAGQAALGLAFLGRRRRRG